MSDLDIYNTYHNLWRIEESFKVMKSDLDARPVFLQKETALKGDAIIPEFRISHSNMALTHKDDKSCCKENLQQLLMFFA